MGKRRKTNVDIRELLHRIQKRESDRAIARQLKMNRKTVAHYRRWAEKQGLLGKELPSVGELSELLEETFANSKLLRVVPPSSLFDKWWNAYAGKSWRLPPFISG
ncbi:hypothetical protein SAMN02746041_00573 [Desulfacinum hydrothermale DSM 13146]|uniref:Homeodomain-like domain-containing protein n=1 Tax=Desulfacinum hydrothermale DSM 13146 TaxID=1121390 RepID=A0A1W1X4U4_9BACT|nr:hypothetical protein [Desulfacinum hydrothermale]SMC18877.1 hypothetical protein SAMN02746041_00573 [Desulfacinum hydrothermale DSM 13146]